MTSDDDAIAARWKALAGRLRSQGYDNEPISAFLDHLADIDDDSIEHEECLGLLPAYVTMELKGEDAESAYPQVAYHLLRCVDCEEAYTDLLTLEMELEPLERGLTAGVVPQVLAVPVYYTRIKLISQRVLEQIQSDTSSLSVALIDPLLAALTAEENIEVPLESDIAGGFGTAQLYAMVIVPVVTAVMSLLITHYLQRQTALLSDTMVRSLVQDELERVLAPQPAKSSIKAKMDNIAALITTIIVNSLVEQ